jgi:fucose permease
MFIIDTYVCGIIYIPGWPQIHYVTKDDLELLILLSSLLLSSAGVGANAIISGLFSIGNQTQGFVHARPVLYQLCYIPVPKFMCIISFM